MVSFVLCFAISECTTKIIFLYQPNVSMMQFIFTRSIVQLIFLAVIINKQAKYVLYDCIESKLVVPLIIRVIMGNITFFMIMYSLKNLPLLIINIVMNT